MFIVKHIPTMSGYDGVSTKNTTGSGRQFIWHNGQAVDEVIVRSADVAAKREFAQYDNVANISKYTEHITRQTSRMKKGPRDRSKD